MLDRATSTGTGAFGAWMYWDDTIMHAASRTGIIHGFSLVAYVDPKLSVHIVAM